jgi:hypothetical protein
MATTRIITERNIIGTAGGWTRDENNNWVSSRTVTETETVTTENE